MQSKLPDINAAIVKYRTTALISFTTDEYLGATIALNAINALLPDEYKVEIDSKKYHDQIQEKKLIVCPNCNGEFPQDSIKILDVYLSNVERFIRNTRYAKKWDCPKCNKENYLADTDTKKLTAQRPYYLGIVPEAPTKKAGVIDRLSFPAEFRRWFGIALDEIESKIGKYRADYAAQNQDREIKIPMED